MASLVVSGDTSGAITLSAPSVAGTNTLSLPAQTATLATLTTPSFATTIGVGGATAAASGAGITFPATVSASSDANTLDDYEEGSWSPQIYYQNATNQAAATNTTQVGFYTKVGNQVTATFLLTFTAPSGLAADNIGVKNLPFAIKSASNYTGESAAYISGSGLTANGYVFQLSNGATQSVLLQSIGSGNLGSTVGTGSRTFAATLIYQT